LNTGYKKQFKGKCRVCGKIGHKGADCWTLEENKEKRPSSYHGETKHNRFTGNCHYCHKKGHQEAECHIKQSDNANNVEEEHALMTSYCAHKENTEMWIGDTGAMCHMRSSTEGKYMSTVTHIRNHKENVLCADRKTKKIVMKNVKVVPGLVKNLFSLTTVMRNDWDL